MNHRVKRSISIYMAMMDLKKEENITEDAIKAAMVKVYESGYYTGHYIATHGVEEDEHGDEGNVG